MIQSQLKTISCYDACGHNGDMTVRRLSGVFFFCLLLCLLQAIWSLLPNLEKFDLSELFDKCKSLNTCTYYTNVEQI